MNCNIDPKIKKHEADLVMNGIVGMSHFQYKDVSKNIYVLGTLNLGCAVAAGGPCCLI
jgi:hypothetical protein